MKTGWQQQFMGLVKPFLKSNSGEGQTPPPEEMEEMEPSMESGISDEFLDKLKSAIETGEVEVEEQAIKTYAKANGLSEEDSIELWNTISEGLSEETETETEEIPEEEVEEPVQKGGNKGVDPEFIAFAKSVGSAIKSAEIHELAIASLVEEHETLIRDNKNMKAELAFLKSEMGKFLKQPMEPKRPVADISGIPGVNSKAEIIQEIVKGIQIKKLALGDLQHYKSTGKMTSAVMEFLKTSKGGN